MASNVRVGLIVSTSLRGFQTFRKAESSFEGLRNVAVRLKAELALLGGYFAFSFIRETIRIFAEFDHSMARVAAVAGASAQELNSLTNEALRLGREFPFTASEAADAMFELAIAGLEVEEVMSAVQATLELAMAGNMGLAESSAIAVATMNAFGMEATDVTEIGDKLSAAFTGSATTLDRLGAGLSFVGPVASLANVSLADTVTTLGLFANAGISGARSGTTFRQMLSRMLDPTAEAQTKMNELGLSFTDAEGNLLPLVDVIEQLIEKQVTANDVISVFGVRAAPGIGALITQGVEGFKEFNAEVVNSEGKLNEIATTMEGSALMSLKKFESAVQDLQIEIGKMMMPTIIAMTESFREEGGLKDALIDTAVAFGDFVAIVRDLFKVLSPLIEMLFDLLAIMAEHKRLVSILIIVFISYKVSIIAAALATKVFAAAEAILIAIQWGKAQQLPILTLLTKQYAAALWAATYPMLIVIGIVGAIILIYKNWGSITEWVGNKIDALGDGLVALKDGAISILAGALYAILTPFIMLGNFIESVKLKIAELTMFIVRLMLNLKNLKDSLSDNTIGRVQGWANDVSEFFGGDRSYSKGGMIPQTGMYLMHAGETVKRREAQEASTGLPEQGASTLVVNVEGYLEGREISLVDDLKAFMKANPSGVI